MGDAISSHLSKSAGDYSKRALESYVTGEIGDFVLFGGIAVEHAIKAILARANPVFIAQDRGFRSAIALNAAQDDVDRLGAGVVTIGGTEALSRLTQLEPHHKDLLDSARELIALRNGEAHLALGDETQRRRVFVVFLRTIEALLQVDSERFWDPHYDVVKATLDERVDEVERITKGLLAAARVTYANRFDGIDEEFIRATIGVTSSRISALVDDETMLPIDCPACESPAVVSGITEETDFEVDFDDDGPVGAYPILTFFASRLQCEICNLELDGSEEIKAAGYDSYWENDLIDVHRWMKDNYEPDEDFGR